MTEYVLVASVFQGGRRGRTVQRLARGTVHRKQLGSCRSGLFIRLDDLVVVAGLAVLYRLPVVLDVVPVITVAVGDVELDGPEDPLVTEDFTLSMELLTVIGSLMGSPVGSFSLVFQSLSL